MVFEALQADRTYSFLVSAFEARSTTPRWGTTCYQVAASGVTVPARCDPLTSQGSLEIDVAALLTMAGNGCSPDNVTSVVGSLATAEEVLTAEQIFPDCPSPMRFDGLPGGFHEVTVHMRLADGTDGASAQCGAEVLPAAVTLADCILS